uniref:Uncharacterized protein n=1 Tax=Chromera velia CCMP2878 TaxID=1169474 RepID=A0A0G4HAC0_9ALVE|eukprot:Cvel_25502.t1-p1 / transcript=Cvel_25502.t1 / gene=Cvel_25502 / organism=Chromera_velia_CCMP2878 / gene_product=hypothetical protein / transcript_product=hypothetical protein / location=Cvel_scaffold2899:11090-20324(+) / protein_length=2124 / sequence_SO=supercontig / SO=protein_coding / is_pseudo=false
MHAEASVPKSRAQKSVSFGSISVSTFQKASRSSADAVLEEFSSETLKKFSKLCNSKLELIKRKKQLLDEELDGGHSGTHGALTTPDALFDGVDDAELDSLGLNPNDAFKLAFLCSHFGAEDHALLCLDFVASRAPELVLQKETEKAERTEESTGDGEEERDGDEGQSERKKSLSFASRLPMHLQEYLAEQLTCTARGREMLQATLGRRLSALQEDDEEERFDFDDLQQPEKSAEELEGLQDGGGGGESREDTEPREDDSAALNPVKHMEKRGDAKKEKEGSGGRGDEGRGSEPFQDKERDEATESEEEEDDEEEGGEKGRAGREGRSSVNSGGLEPLRNTISASSVSVSSSSSSSSSSPLSLSSSTPSISFRVSARDAEKKDTEESASLSDTSPDREKRAGVEELNRQCSEEHNDETPSLMPSKSDMAMQPSASVSPFVAEDPRASHGFGRRRSFEARRGSANSDPPSESIPHGSMRRESESSERRGSVIVHQVDADSRDSGKLQPETETEESSEDERGGSHKKSSPLTAFAEHQEADPASSSSAALFDKGDNEQKNALEEVEVEAESCDKELLERLGIEEEEAAEEKGEEKDTSSNSHLSSTSLDSPLYAHDSRYMSLSCIRPPACNPQAEEEQERGGGEVEPFEDWKDDEKREEAEESDTSPRAVSETLVTARRIRGTRVPPQPSDTEGVPIGLSQSDDEEVDLEVSPDTTVRSPAGRLVFSLLTESPDSERGYSIERPSADTSRARDTKRQQQWNPESDAVPTRDICAEEREEAEEEKGFQPPFRTRGSPNDHTETENEHCPPLFPQTQRYVADSSPTIVITPPNGEDSPNANTPSVLRPLFFTHTSPARQALTQVMEDEDLVAITQEENEAVTADALYFQKDTAEPPKPLTETPAPSPAPIQQTPPNASDVQSQPKMQDQANAKSAASPHCCAASRDAETLMAAAAQNKLSSHLHQIPSWYRAGMPPGPSGTQGDPNPQPSVQTEIFRQSHAMTKPLLQPTRPTAPLQAVAPQESERFSFAVRSPPPSSCQVMLPHFHCQNCSSPVPPPFLPFYDSVNCSRPLVYAPTAQPAAEKTKKERSGLAALLDEMKGRGKEVRTKQEGHVGFQPEMPRSYDRLDRPPSQKDSPIPFSLAALRERDKRKKDSRQLDTSYVFSAPERSALQSLQDGSANKSLPGSGSNTKAKKGAELQKRSDSLSVPFPGDASLSLELQRLEEEAEERLRSGELSVEVTALQRELLITCRREAEVAARLSSISTNLADLERLNSQVIAGDLPQVLFQSHSPPPKQGTNLIRTKPQFHPTRWEPPASLSALRSAPQAIAPPSPTGARLKPLLPQFPSGSSHPDLQEFLLSRQEARLKQQQQQERSRSADRKSPQSSLQALLAEQKKGQKGNLTAISPPKSRQQPTITIQGASHSPPRFFYQDGPHFAPLSDSEAKLTSRSAATGSRVGHTVRSSSRAKLRHSYDHSDPLNDGKTPMAIPHNVGGQFVWMEQPALEVPGGALMELPCVVHDSPPQAPLQQTHNSPSGPCIVIPAAIDPPPSPPSSPPRQAPLGRPQRSLAIAARLRTKALRMQRQQRQEKQQRLRAEEAERRREAEERGGPCLPVSKPQGGSTVGREPAAIVSSHVLSNPPPPANINRSVLRLTGSGSADSASFPRPIRAEDEKEKQLQKEQEDVPTQIIRGTEDTPVIPPSANADTSCRLCAIEQQPPLPLVVQQTGVMGRPSRRTTSLGDRPSDLKVSSIESLHIRHDKKETSDLPETQKKNQEILEKEPKEDLKKQTADAPRRPPKSLSWEVEIKGAARRPLPPPPARLRDRSSSSRPKSLRQPLSPSLRSHLMPHLQRREKKGYVGGGVKGNSLSNKEGPRKPRVETQSQPQVPTPPVDVPPPSGPVKVWRGGPAGGPPPRLSLKEAQTTVDSMTAGNVNPPLKGRGKSHLPASTNTLSGSRGSNRPGRMRRTLSLLSTEEEGTRAQRKENGAAAGGRIDGTHQQGIRTNNEQGRNKATPSLIQMRNRRKQLQEIKTKGFLTSKARKGFEKSSSMTPSSGGKEAGSFFVELHHSSDSDLEGRHDRLTQARHKNESINSLSAPQRHAPSPGDDELRGSQGNGALGSTPTMRSPLLR